MASLQQITAKDIAGWDSLSDVASTFEKRGLKVRDNLGEDNELVLQLTDREFIVLVEAGPGESASDFKPDDRRRRTNLVATNDYEEFTFLTRIRALDGQQHGRIKHQKLSFTKEQMTSEGGEKNTILQKLNSLEYGSAAAIYDDLYDTKQVVKEFYQQFETLRTDLVQEVAGIPDDRGDAKQRYVQVTLDRMIFLYFIQEKRLLDRDPNYLHDHHKQRVDDENVYEEFYEPLFFDFLAERGKKSTEFGALPYLNGGLFSKNPIEEEFEDARLGETPEQTNEMFGDILDFLSDWNWNVDERLDIVDPKNLSPAILGHIFEQTVNQKEMGAYYTPEEITGFMSRRTIHPYLLDQLNEEVGASYEEIDDVFGFPSPDAESGVEALADGGAVTAQVPTQNVETRHVEALYHDFLKEARVLDPAVGSGAFLLAAQEVLLDIYMQCIEFFQQVEDEGRAWELEERTVEELETIEGGRGSASLYAKRSIILNNLYGVDIDDGAVEICKLRLWLSMVADIEDEPKDVEPLPNIDFNIRQGNSLIGYVEELPSNNGITTLGDWNVREKYQEIIEAVQKHRDATGSKEASNWRKIAEERMNRHRPEFDEQLAQNARDQGVGDLTTDEIQSFDPFHWILEFAEVWDEGRFDVIIGNPPWEVLSPNRDQFFSRYDETFRQYDSEQKDEIQERLLEDSAIATEWEEYRESMEQRADYFNNSPDYTLQTPTVAGRAVASENDLSALFTERLFDLIAADGYASLILPGFVLNGAIAKDLRRHLLDNTELDTVVGFENNGIFDQIHGQYRFGIVACRNGGTTDGIQGIFDQKTTEVLRNVDEVAAHIPREVLTEYSPEAGIFPAITEQREVNALSNIISHPPLVEQENQPWWADIVTKELHEPTDKKRLFSDPEKGDYPVYTGSCIYQFQHDNSVGADIDDPRLWSVEDDEEYSAKYRVREKAFRKGYLKKAIYTQFGGESTSKSQKAFVNDLLEEHRGRGLTTDDVLPDFSEYRIGYRAVTNSTNERTMIATLIPKGIPCIKTVQLFRPYSLSPDESDLSSETLHSAYKRIFSDRELAVVTGLLNSLPFDYLMRTKVATDLVKYKLEESQMPRLTEGDNWFQYISERAARLNCYGEMFEEMRDRLGGIEPVTSDKERRKLQAELDAAAFHAYGFERRDVEFVLDDFHRVSDPQLMTDEYFDMVFEKFDLLESEGPLR
ncbi:Eco57I restriction-modification methylase domain-containing protein [Haloarchaeobius sp. DT45]|uniref:Eco57I restriction-modification methylase domain-containing protein n=1 Tax=Haloarchaeobius sp. DT45 TaxID=3446116 RepID=UPI003F6A99A3